MANKTNNYKLPKPEADDFYDISEYNKTMDILDDSLTEMDEKKLDKNGDASEAITEFEQEVLRENIESGETLSSTFGKVKKWFSEMKDVAFSGHAKDVATDAVHRFVSDVEKSSWNGKVEAVGGDISQTVIGSLQSIATEFPIPNQGESSNVFLGKVKKFIQDFNNFKTGIITVGKLANNGNTTSVGYALDARYGKTLYDLYKQLYANFDNKPYIRMNFYSRSECNLIKQKGITSLYIHINGNDIPDLNTFETYELPIIIPEEYRPVYNINFVPAIVDRNFQIGIFFFIQPDGKVFLGTRFNTLNRNNENAHIYFNTIYPSN